LKKRIQPKFVPIEQWGKDHWAMFSFVETECVDNHGRLNGDHMRINYARHPGHPPKRRFSGDTDWNPAHGTRLKDYFEDKKKILPEHDDMYCLEDFEAAGLIEIISMINGYVKLTKRGLKVANKLRNFKANGGQFADFEYPIKEWTSR
jgi:hypothetical protein